MKKCKYCQTEIDDKAKICPNCKKKQGISTGFKIIIIIVIILFCIVGCVNSCSDSVNDTIDNTKDSYKDINGKSSFNLNETFENKYEKITMTEINTNFTDYSEYLEPASNKKYIMLKFEIENINEEKDELYVSSLDFNAYADGVAVKTAYIGNDNYEDFSSTVGKGKKTIGYIFYEVPTDSKEITVEYNADFWTEGNSIKFIVQ